MKRFYEVKVRGNATNPETGTIKPAEFNYLIKGEDWAMVEQLALMATADIATEIDIPAIKRSNIVEVFEDSSKSKFYRCKVVMYVMDGERESKTKVMYLVSGDSTVDADTLLKQSLGKEFSYDISDIAETKICEVIDENPSEEVYHGSNENE